MYTEWLAFASTTVEPARLDIAGALRRDHPILGRHEIPNGLALPGGAVTAWPIASTPHGTVHPDTEGASLEGPMVDNSVIRSILNEEDVEGLLAAGAPADEYDLEARMIAEALAKLPQHERVLERVLDVLTEVCSRMFGPFDEEQLRQRGPVYHRLAQRILNLDVRS
jgi:hypothetical protein